MAKIKIYTTHQQETPFVLECNGGVSILNDGTVKITLPKELGIKLGFTE